MSSFYAAFAAPAWLPRWQSVVDFAVVLIVIYFLLLWGRKARALRIALGIVALRAAALLAQQFGLALTTWVLDAASLVAVVLLLIVFQPELRHALLHLDFAVQSWRRRNHSDSLEPQFIALAEAAFALAHSGRGALLVFVRQDPIDELITGGIPLGGEISREIIEAIFRKVSPVHDGAAVIESNRIARVGVVLPLTLRSEVPGEYGTRHRAAMGLAERSDAVVIVVSEERGIVTLMCGDEIAEVARVNDLVARLVALCGSSPPGVPAWRRNLGLKAAAAGLASLIWAISFGLTGTTVRTVVVPVAFSNVRPGLRITSQSTSTLHLQLRGSTWLFDSASLSGVSGRLNLEDLREGPHSIPVRTAVLNLPPGVQVERVSPENISVTLVRK